MHDRFNIVIRISADLGVNYMRPLRVNVEAGVALEPLQQVLDRRRLGPGDALARFAVHHPHVLLARELRDLELGGIEATDALVAATDVAANHFT